MAEETPDPQQRPQTHAAAALNSSLHSCSHAGNLEGVRKAVKEGADINSWHDQTGLTALHIAVGTNNLALVQYLLEAGAKLIPDRAGRWPTVIAAECRADDELCDYIVEREAMLIVD